MKKFLLYLSIMLVALFVVLFIVVKVADEPLPDGLEGDAAEKKTERLLQALNKQAYDSLSYIEWKFPRGHHFQWYKNEDSVIVRWGDYKVQLKTNDLTGVAYRAERKLEGDEKDEAVRSAWSLFANDSFWLVAPYKVRDPGTSRRIVETQEGEALLITYSSGGVTPGDSYLWFFDDEGLPRKWKMWVSIIPVGGLELSWEGGSRYEGAWFGPIHKGVGPFSVDLEIIEIR